MFRQCTCIVQGYFSHNLCNCLQTQEKTPVRAGDQPWKACLHAYQPSVVATTAPTHPAPIAIKKWVRTEHLIWNEWKTVNRGDLHHGWVMSARMRTCTLGAFQKGARNFRACTPPHTHDISLQNQPWDCKHTKQSARSSSPVFCFCFVRNKKFDECTGCVTTMNESINGKTLDERAEIRVLSSSVSQINYKISSPLRHLAISISHLL